MKKYFREFNVSLPSDFDEEEVGLSLTSVSCAGIKSIVNDVVLRNGFDNITMEMIDKSIYSITDRVKDAPKEDNLEVAVHEAGHAVVAKAFPEFFTINRLGIDGASGEFHAVEVEKGFWPYEKAIADIQISIAGVLAQKVLFNRCGYSSCWETLPKIDDYTRQDTFIKRRKMERKIEALLRKCERQTTRYVKKNKEEIIRLGTLLFKEKNLKSSQIHACIGKD